MIEILVIWLLARKIGGIVKEKGRSSGGYIVLTIVLWIGGELVGAIVGSVLAFELGLSDCLVYPFALTGAACGAGLAYLIASNVSEKTPAPVDAEAVPSPAEVETDQVEEQGYE